LFRLYKADGGNSALANCLLHGDTVGQGGLIYKEPPISLGTNPGHSKTVSTNNTTVSVAADGFYYWRVTYAPAAADTAHLGRQSDCVENTELTFTNDAGTGTAFP
jgi:hypothetical protein